MMIEVRVNIKRRKKIITDLVHMMKQKRIKRKRRKKNIKDRMKINKRKNIKRKNPIVTQDLEVEINSNF